MTFIQRIFYNPTKFNMDQNHECLKCCYDDNRFDEWDILKFSVFSSIFIHIWSLNGGLFGGFMHRTVYLRMKY